jgi:hypothetical protein
MVRIFEAFDRGLDIDQAFNEVYQTTPEHSTAISRPTCAG